MKKAASILFVILFLLACGAPTVGMIFLGPSDTVANEVPAPVPALKNRDGSLNLDLLSGAADYLSQRFALRREAITLWAELNARVLRTSIVDDVVLGRGGWLYYAPTLPGYTRSDPMTDREIWCAARTLFLLQQYAGEQGAEFLFTIAPDKLSLYDEHLPARTRLPGDSDARRLEQAMALMGVHYADLFSAFGREGQELYFPTDSHWNAQGAALAADAILASLGRRGGFAAGPFAKDSHRGDLYEMLYPAGTSVDADFPYAPGFTFTSDSQNPDSITIRTQNDAGEGRLLLYRDSFGRNLYPYLAQSFAQATFSRKNVYDPTSLRDGDTMVIELVERNLRYLNANVPLFPAPAYALGARSLRDEAEEIKLALANGGPEEYTAFYGVFGTLTPDADSPVLIAVGDGAMKVFEALPQPGGFTACLADADAAGPVRIIFCTGGEWVCLPGVWESE